MLKVMAFMITAPKALPRMRPARGLEVMRLSGMIGRATFDSMYTKRGKVRLATTREVMTSG